MSKILPVIVCTAALAGCRTPITPEQSWSDYSRYYKATGENVAVAEGVANVRSLKSKETDSAVASLKAQGYVVMGKFEINDGTDITRNAVEALAQKLGASEVVWCTVNTLPTSARALQNPDMGIVGVDNAGFATMNADRPDQSVAEQMLEGHHTIWMLGKKGK